MPTYLKSNKDICEMLNFWPPHINNVREEILTELNLAKNSKKLNVPCPIPKK